MRLFSRQKPKIKIESAKSDGFSGWIKCSGCEETIHKSELKNNINCCPKCNFHYRITLQQRIQLLADEKTFVEMFDHLEAKDPLSFEDSEKYIERIARAKDKTKRKEAVIVGVCEMEGHKTALAIMDFSYMGGSMGSVVGEMLTLIIEHATSHRLPMIIVSASGGARMQESTLSLMQMAKTSAALAKHSEAGLPYISVLTNPTTGGVTASFAFLGDIIIAEPKALIGFAGPRVVEQTIGHKLPPGAQRSEFLLEKGMIDCIAPRKELKRKIVLMIEFLSAHCRK
ncbi:MAG: acetyl-CoA carboxylase, carboxyltransferase subunit beta [Simkaniaceae bacterium]|nr:acetyl-CoA carboxylase, carboxyltransferase subunit beta [Simkaniaceae bacterium]MCF7852488.1 acetyl-CoA carboxylase, carboxyltransferase subunit beta [Simkaniaceae bacterium]